MGTNFIQKFMCMSAPQHILCRDYAGINIILQLHYHPVPAIDITTFSMLRSSSPVNES